MGRDPAEPLEDDCDTQDCDDTSQSSKGPSDSTPYVPSWCYDPPGPRMCKCGHHEGYHGDDGHCNQQRYGTCTCPGFADQTSGTTVGDEHDH